METRESFVDLYAFGEHNCTEKVEKKKRAKVQKAHIFIQRITSKFDLGRRERAIAWESRIYPPSLKCSEALSRGGFVIYRVTNSGDNDRMELTLSIPLQEVYSVMEFSRARRLTRNADFLLYRALLTAVLCASPAVNASRRRVVKPIYTFHLRDSFSICIYASRRGVNLSRGAFDYRFSIPRSTTTLRLWADGEVHFQSRQLVACKLSA